MKPPAPTLAQADNTWQITAMLNAMTVAQLTTLIAQAEDMRAEKMSDAKKELLDRFRAEAEALGLSVESLLAPAPPAARNDLPPDWHRRVINFLKFNQGRAPIRKLHSVVWPPGGSKGLGTKLRAALADLVAQGELVIIRKGGEGGHTIYGLASMVEVEIAA